MAIFTPRTFPEILGQMVARIISVTPLTDLNVGSVFTTMLEAAAQEDDEQYFQMLEIIRAFSLDTTTGADLDNRAAEYSITRLPAQFASSVVNISDKAVTKVITQVYSGLPGSAAGSFSVRGAGIAGFPNNGAIIVGRGTSRTETVTYTSITNNGSYYTFNLSTAFTFDHGTDETIILSQGGARTISGGAIVKVPASDLNPEIAFTLQANATILDGEHEIDNVPVSASVEGSSANVPIGSIIQFDSLPFPTAAVTNPIRVTNGADEESDQALRDRIKATIQSLSRGTGQSIITGIVGLVSVTENKRVVSAALIEPTIPADVVRVFIDDGTGIILQYIDVGFETLITSAVGGEKFVNVHNVPVVKAFVETQNSEPYNLIGGETLFVETGGIVETITFNSLDFATPGKATAQEVLKKINGTANLFESRKTQDGSKVKVFARSNFDEEIRVTGGTANAILDFQTDLRYTMRLYRTTNNIARLLTKDGITASFESANPASYSFAVRKNLITVVDGKYSSPQITWFSPSDFPSPATVTVPQVLNSLNNSVSGVLAQASSNNTKITMTSRTQRSAQSMIVVVENWTQAWTFNGAYTDVTGGLEDVGGAVPLFAAQNDVLYLGHKDLKFNTAAVDLSVVASGSINPLFEYWNGSAWVAFGALDGTAGFTNTHGHITFNLLPDWAKTAVNSSVPQYWIRITRQAAAITGPTTNYLKVGDANITLGFSEIPVLGADKDYTLNRFIGQIELAQTMNSGESLSIGSFNTRATVVAVGGPYGLVGGETLNVTVDGQPETVNFQVSDFGTPGSASAVEVIARINKDLNGATAAIAGVSGLKVTSNTFNGGTIQITGGSSNAFLQFPLIEQFSNVPHVPSIVSGSSQPFAFRPGDNIIIVMDENAANNFTTPCTRPSVLSSATSSTVVADTTLAAVFQNDTDLPGFDFLYSEEYRAVIQDITYVSTNPNKAFVNISYTTGGTAGAEAVTVIGFNINIKIQSGVSTANQIVTAFLASPQATALAAVSVSGLGTNPQTAPVPATYVTAPRSQITAYNHLTGQLTLSPAIPFTPAIGDTYEIAPRTAAQIVFFWSNKQIALITNNAEIRTVSGGSNLQIASLQAGELAGVQVAGGPGNDVLNFTTQIILGVDAYRFYTGLPQITQWTIDGRISDPTTYPGIRAAGVQVEVIEPVTVPISVTMVVTPNEGVTLSSIQNDVKSAVSAYINSLPVGGEVVRSSIIVAVKAVQGVFDVHISVPVDNIPIAFNELARIKDNAISVG